MTVTVVFHTCVLQILQREDVVGEEALLAASPPPPPALPPGPALQTPPALPTGPLLQTPPVLQEPGTAGCHSSLSQPEGRGLCEGPGHSLGLVELGKASEKKKSSFLLHIFHKWPRTPPPVLDIRGVTFVSRFGKTYHQKPPLNNLKSTLKLPQLSQNFWKRFDPLLKLPQSTP